jgi:hypothetical protein
VGERGGVYAGAEAGFGAVTLVRRAPTRPSATLPPLRGERGIPREPFVGISDERFVNIPPERFVGIPQERCIPPERAIPAPPSLTNGADC